MTPSRNPIRLRYSLCFELDSGERVDLQFDGMREALSWTQRGLETWDFWELCDRATGNVVSSSDRKRT